MKQGRTPSADAHAGKRSRAARDDPPQPLTLKEKRVLEFLEAYIRENGISPTYREICQRFGFASFNSVQRYLKQLEFKGYVRVPWGNQKRAITLLKAARSWEAAMQSLARFPNEALTLPLLGRVAAGSPIEALENDEFNDVPASLVRHADRTYALRVQGNSMIEDGILDGDVILVQRQARAENGDIVVAVIGDEAGQEATVKRLYLHERGKESDSLGDAGCPGRSLELRPANSDMKSMWYEPTEVQVKGIVVGLIRRF